MTDALRPTRGKRVVAVIGGTGDQGFGLAVRLAMAGENVIIGSRQRPKAEDAARRVAAALGRDCCVGGMENAEAAKAANIIILTVPFAAQIGILRSIRDSFKPGDILVDVTVPLATAIEGKPTRTLGVWQGSAAEQAAELVPNGMKVVSAFNNVSAEQLQDLKSKVECDVIVCGDDAEAKRTVMGLVEELPGARPVDGGPLENARIVEQLTALLVSINIRYGVSSAGVRITGIPV